MLLAALLTLSRPPQTTGLWEKLLAPGVTYRMEIVEGPLLVHAVRVTPQAEGVLMAGELAGGKVFEPESPTKGRETVSAMAERTRALVTVNADFFPYTGDPLGTMVRDGELLSSPHNGRAAFCWGRGHARAAYLTFAGSLVFEGQSVPLYGVNQECGENMAVLNTPAARYATSREPATHAVMLLTDKIAPTGEWRPRVKRVVENATSVPINDDEVVLTFRGTPKERLTFLSSGDEVVLRLDCKGADWSKIEHAVGGGPFLVRDGKPSVPFAAEGFTDGFAKNRHPRTAVGRTREGDLWIVAVDGRQAVSTGVALEDLAALMLRLGCVEAINLDGGGSTTFNIGGLTVNRPSEGSERPVANALLVFSTSYVPAPVPVGEPLPVIAGPATIKVGQVADYRLVGVDGEDVPPSEVVWGAQGAAWVDQAGFLRGWEEGECRLTALARGQSVTLRVTVAKG